MTEYNYKIVYESRASYILYNLFSNCEEGVVLLPANVCPIVPATLLKMNVSFEFIDIDPITLAMDMEQAMDRVRRKSPQIAGLIYVRTYGYSGFNAMPFFEGVKSLNPNILLVDDHCLAIPSFTPWSTAADVLLFSTGYSKVAELGRGGYAFIAEAQHYERVELDYESSDHDKLLDIFGSAIEEGEKIESVDFNWLDASVPSMSFAEYREEVETKLQSSLRHKKKLNEIYCSILPEDISLPSGFQNWRYNIRVNNKSRILKEVFDKQLFASSHYAPVSNIFADHHAPVAERLGGQVINLFNDHRFSEGQAADVATIVVSNL